jgi:tyrosine-protein phosphatase SIW14
VKLALLCLAPALLWAAGPPAPHVHNFGEINDHIYRGAAPSPVALQELRALGVKVILDLRVAGEGSQAESVAVRKLGMKYINVPLSAWSAPTRAQIEHIFPLLFHSDTEPVFIHCRRGKDRTGTILACYRIQHDNWNSRRALEEANGYGMSRLERSMRAFVLQFTPVILPDLRPTGQ